VYVVDGELKQLLLSMLNVCEEVRKARWRGGEDEAKAVPEGAMLQHERRQEYSGEPPLLLAAYLSLQMRL
jgi:hypothetical protein